MLLRIKELKLSMNKKVLKDLLDKTSSVIQLKAAVMSKRLNIMLGIIEEGDKGS